MNFTETTTKKDNKLKRITGTLLIFVILLVSNAFAQFNSLGENDRIYFGSYDASPGQDIPVQVFVTKADEKVRPSHAALHNTVWDANDPNAPVPPLDFGCRCKIEFRARNKTTAERTGLPPPPVNPIPLPILLEEEAMGVPAIVP